MLKCTTLNCVCGCYNLHISSLTMRTMEFDTTKIAKKIGKYKWILRLLLGIFFLILGLIVLVHFIEHRERPGDTDAQFTADVGADTTTPTTVGEGFFIPHENLLGEILISGYPVLKLDVRCIVETNLSITSSHRTYYENTKAFYSQIGFEFGLQIPLETFFTLGLTLKAVARSISEYDISGLTFTDYAFTKVKVLDQECLPEVTLSDQVARAFEQLPSTIDRPWLTSSWTEYDNFLKTYGSHVVTQEHYGSSLYQHVFGKSSFHYDEKKFRIKICALLPALEELDLDICGGITEKDIKSASNIKATSTFVVRGGSPTTRAKLYANRSPKLISQF